jgi:hypothetical protein
MDDQETNEPLPTHAPGTVGLASHLIATASPAIRLASQAVGLLPEASEIGSATEAVTASAEAVQAQARQAGQEELTAAVNELLTGVASLAQLVATFVGRAHEVAVSAGQLGSPAVRLASFANHLQSAVAPVASEPSVLTEADVDRLLTQKLDQTLADFRTEMEQFRQPATGGGKPAEAEAEGRPSPPKGSRGASK